MRFVYFITVVGLTSAFVLWIVASLKPGGDWLLDFINVFIVVIAVSASHKKKASQATSLDPDEVPTGVMSYDRLTSRLASPPRSPRASPSPRGYVHSLHGDCLPTRAFAAFTRGGRLFLLLRSAWPSATCT
jgi:hypothetical protein